MNDRARRAPAREVEVEDPVARRRIVRRHETVLRGERTSDAGLTLIVLAPREDEMIVGTAA